MLRATLVCARMLDDDTLRTLARAIARIEELLERLPLEVAKDLRARIATLRTVLLEKRPPALVQVQDLCVLRILRVE